MTDYARPAGSLFPRYLIVRVQARRLLNGQGQRRKG